MKKIISKNFKDHLNVLQCTLESLSKSIELASYEMVKTLENGGTIFWFGNGGSCADSQHLAAELTGRFKKDRKPLRSISLTADNSVITCIANDYSYDQIFARQILGLVRKDDLVIAISTSGNSPNIVNGLRITKDLGIKSIALLGNDGGLSRDLTDLPIIIPSNSTARIQEIHILIGHIFCEYVDDNL